jgi:single-stranded-DNA-specific exonuclease
VVVAKQWIVNEIDEEKRDWISRQLGISPLLATVLVGRGIDEPGMAERYLKPQVSHLNDPFLLPDIDTAVGRIWKAITDHEKIIVFGHDDTDGATSTAIMMETLKGLGAHPDDYIPNRTTEGYGFRQNVLERFEKDGVSLVITVDSESSDFPGVRMANDIGLDVIITDHHEIQGSLPRALAVINPKRGDSRYPFRNLAGVGVAYQLARALTGDAKFDFEHHLDLAALGTIADRVPLVEDNRVFSRLGEGRLRISHRTGIATLRRLMGEQTSAQQMNGPLKFGKNQGGKFSSSRLLQTDDAKEAEKIARELLWESQEKREKTETACQRLLDLVQEKRLFESPVITVVDYETPVRALGSCASTIRRHYGQPAVAIGFKEGHVVGEGRAPAGFDIFAAFSYCEDLFLQYGGHRGAGGFSMDPQNINAFRQKINRYAQEISGWRYSAPFVRIDALLDPSRVDADQLAQLRCLTPFGQANPDPLFLCRKARVEVFADPNADGAHGTINAVPFRVDEDRGAKSTLLATLVSSRAGDVIFTLTQAQDETLLVLIEDVKVD